MFGLNIEPLLVIITLVAIVVTIYCIASRNPHGQDTKEGQSLRMARIGLCFALWSYGFGLLGLLLGIVGAVFGIIAVIKGRASYGLAVTVLGIALPFIGFAVNLGMF